MNKHRMIRFLLQYILISLLFSSGLFAEYSRDIVLKPSASNAYQLSKGVVQFETYFSYINLDLAKGLGSDIDSNSANGVGEYMEKGGMVWFGLTNRWMASFQFSLNDFEYSNKKAEVSFQELKLKRSLILDDNKWGFLAAEAAWRRHSTNQLEVSGITQSLSNVLHDHGWGLRLLHSKPFETFDIHSFIGYNNYGEDGDNGQTVMEFGLGVSKFWAKRYQLDIYFKHYRISRDNPAFSSRDSDDNNTLSLGLMRHLSDHWAIELRSQFNDNLFRGTWPFMDREIDRLNFSRYGFFTIGLTYRYDYSER